jgi:hypothetical protein
MFRAVPLPIIRSYPLYIRHWHMLNLNFTNKQESLVYTCTMLIFLKKKNML